MVTRGGNLGVVTFMSREIAESTLDTYLQDDLRVEVTGLCSLKDGRQEFTLQVGRHGACMFIDGCQLRDGRVTLPDGIRMPATYLRAIASLALLPCGPTPRRQSRTWSRRAVVVPSRSDAPYFDALQAINAVTRTVKRARSVGRTLDYRTTEGTDSGTDAE